MKKDFYTVIFTKDAAGGYTADVPALTGCISEGGNLSEAKKNIAEAIELYLESLAADGIEIPREKKVVERKIPVSFPVFSNESKNSCIPA